MSITIIIIAITVIVSLMALQNHDLFEKFSFYPIAIFRNKEWGRMLSVGFVHADITHLIFNMLTLYFFGSNVEQYFIQLFENGALIYSAYYFTALIVSGIPDLIMKKNDYSYRAVGASGAVASMLFTAILFDPKATLYLQFFIPVPAALFGVGYLAYSFYMAKRGTDNIGHLTHFAGAVFGLIFPLILEPRIFIHFINQLTT